MAALFLAASFKSGVDGAERLFLASRPDRDASQNEKERLRGSNGGVFKETHTVIAWLCAMQWRTGVSIHARFPRNGGVPDSSQAPNFAGTLERKSSQHSGRERGRNARADTKQPVGPAWGCRMVDVASFGCGVACVDAAVPAGRADGVAGVAIAGGCRLYGCLLGHGQHASELPIQQLGYQQLRSEWLWSCLQQSGPVQPVGR